MQVVCIAQNFDKQKAVQVSLFQMPYVTFTRVTKNMQTKHMFRCQISSTFSSHVTDSLPWQAKLSSIIMGNSGQSVVLQDKSIKLIFPPDWSQDYLDHPSVEENKYMKWNYGFLGTWDPFLYLNPWKWLSDIYMHLLQIPSPYLAARMKACTFDLDGLIMPARDRWRARNCSLLQQKQTLHS